MSAVLPSCSKATVMLIVSDPEAQLTLSWVCMSALSASRALTVSWCPHIAAHIRAVQPSCDMTAKFVVAREQFI